MKIETNDDEIENPERQERRKGYDDNPNPIKEYSRAGRPLHNPQRYLKQ